MGHTAYIIDLGSVVVAAALLAGTLMAWAAIVLIGG
jgi:hypothetical protein